MLYEVITNVLCHRMGGRTGPVLIQVCLSFLNLSLYVQLQLLLFDRAGFRNSFHRNVIDHRQPDP